jgi:uncharacterized protein (DUF1015 family)
MVKIKGFKGLRPRKYLVEKIASRPYDVLNTGEAREEVKGNPYSFLHVVRSEIDLPTYIDAYDEKVYQKAAENLNKMIQNGWLFQDKQDAMYIYRQIMGHHTQYGLMTVSSVQDYSSGRIRIHELTREKKEKDRINHVLCTNANTGPVFLTYRAKEEIDSLVEQIIDEENPEYDFVADDGVRHTLWIVGDKDDIDNFIKLFQNIPYTYVADGHHRAKSAAMVGEILRGKNKNHTGNEEYNWFLSVLFPHTQLKILGYNRVVRDLNGLEVREFLEKIEEKFSVKRAEGKKQAEPKRPNQFGMYLDKNWYILEPKMGIFDTNDPVGSLDVSILQNNILAPILGIEDPRKDDRIDFIGGIRGLGELEKRVHSGGMVVAFALYPTSIKQLMTIADAGKLMPPKSTWFEPKLRSGLVIHHIY